MKTENLIDALRFINEKYRDLVNGKIQKQRPDDIDPTTHIKESLRINSTEDWGIICASMDVVDDSALGLKHFLLFGIDGPTKYNDIGEKYIRLYGVLNASYLQQQAILNLYKKSNTDKPSDATQRINELQLRTIRHKLGAHSVDYDNKEDNTIESFVPVRVSMGGLSCNYYNNKTLKEESVEFQQVILEHLLLMISLYTDLYKKSVQTIYKSNAQKIASLLFAIKDTKAKMNGHTVIKNDAGDLIFTTKIINTNTPNTQPLTQSK